MKKIGILGGILTTIVIGCTTIGGVIIFGVSDSPQLVETTDISVHSEKQNELHKVSGIKLSDVESKKQNVTEEKRGEGIKCERSILEYLAYLSTIVGIFIPLGAWALGRRKPLKIKTIVINKKERRKSSFNFYVTNIKDYPITIYEITLFTDRLYMVTKNKEHMPVITGPGYTINNKVLFAGGEWGVNSNGRTHIRLEKELNHNIDKLFINLKTSHGYQTIKCKDIEFIEKEVEVSDEWFDFNSLIPARIVYYGLMTRWPWLRSLVRNYAEKWKTGRD